MTPDDREILQGLGIAIYRDFQYCVGVALLYGIFFPLAVISMYTLVERRGVVSYTTKTTLCVITFGLLAATGFAVTYMGILFILIRSAMIQNIGLSLMDKQQLTNILLISWNNVSIWCQQLPLLINDALIIWRAWVIFSQRRWALYFLILLWMATAGTTIGYVAILSGPAPDPDLDPGLYNVAVALANASPALSFGTNSMATSFIAYVLWGQLRIIRKSPARGQAQFKAMYPAIVTYLIHGPFSMIGIHETATAVYQSQESPS